MAEAPRTAARPDAGARGERPLLITGANGHLGRKLCARLAGERRVRAVVRSERAAGMLRELPESERPEVDILDYADEAALEAAARGCGAAVHLVGIIVEGANSRYVDAHEATCRALCRAANNAGLERIVYLSILGSRPDSANPCLASKGAAERILLDGPVPATVLRVPMVLGPDDVASRSLAGQARARWLPLVGGGRTLQQPIDAGDVIEAVLAALSRPDLANCAIDLGGPECVPHRELVSRAGALFQNRPRVVPIPLVGMQLVAWVLERISASPPISRAMLGVLQHDDRVDAAAAAERLGITLTPLDETLKRCLANGTEAG